MKRQRGRNRNNNNNKNNNHGNRQLDSNGPDVKVRGSATQIHDKYVTLARDAAVSGNRVKAENYRQHAEHYLRLMNIQEAAKQAAREEAEAARLARGEETQDATENSAGQSNQNSNGDDRKGRRYPPRVRKSRDDKSTEGPQAQNEGVTATEAEVAVPPTTSPDVGVSTDPVLETEDKPKRRRRAPSRKKIETEPVIDAAE